MRNSRQRDLLVFSRFLPKLFGWCQPTRKQIFPRRRRRQLQNYAAHIEPIAHKFRPHLGDIAPLDSSVLCITHTVILRLQRKSRK